MMEMRPKIPLREDHVPALSAKALVDAKELHRTKDLSRHEAARIPGFASAPLMASAV